MNGSKDITREDQLIDTLQPKSVCLARVISSEYLKSTTINISYVWLKIINVRQNHKIISQHFGKGNILENTPYNLTIKVNIYYF